MITDETQMALWASEVVYGLDPLETLYWTSQQGAEDEAERWIREHCSEDVPLAYAHKAVPVAVALCEDCGQKHLATQLTLVAEGGHGQGVDGHPSMLMCVRCHEENHQDRHGICRARMVGDICDTCFPETAARIRYARKHAPLASANDGEREHAEVFEGVGS